MTYSFRAASPQMVRRPISDRESRDKNAFDKFVVVGTGQGAAAAPSLDDVRSGTRTI
jgi:hypothetical protein